MTVLGVDLVDASGAVVAREAHELLQMRLMQSLLPGTRLDTH